MSDGGDSLARVVGDKSECDACDTQLMISQSGTFNCYQPWGPLSRTLQERS